MVSHTAALKVEESDPEMPSMPKTPALFLLATLFLLGTPLAVQAQGDVRADLLRRINDERARGGAPPLRLSPALGQVAQQHAEEMGRSGNLRQERASSDRLHRLIKQAGYDVREWTESMTATDRNPASLLRTWAERDPGSYRKLLHADYRDLGIGVSRLQGQALYAFLFAVPESEAFGRETASLRDLAAVRAEMLRRVNDIRRRQRLATLAADPKLDRAAQAHAEDMLKRGYFEHKSPDGITVRERSKAAGYNWRSIGENIAEGQLSVAEVVDTWMNSPGHRRNLLDPGFRELGVGLALGNGRGGYRVLWVQNFGTPR
jgi:uncharacterized protein YkwD